MEIIIKIEKGIPFQRAVKSKWIPVYAAMDTMKVGESFFLPFEFTKYPTLTQTLKRYGLTNNKEIKYATVQGGWRVWRIK